MRQLPLGLPAAPACYDESNFVVTDSNREAYTKLIEAASATGCSLLEGPPGSGKTHLARIWAAKQNAVWLDAATLDDKAIDIWLGAPEPFVVDGLVPGEKEALYFHFLNLSKEYQQPCLIVCDGEALPKLRLQDLVSRLRAASYLHLQEPDEALLEALFFKLFNDRQLLILPAVLRYLVTHVERSAKSVQRIVETLDQQALEKKQNITVAFIRSICQNEPHLLRN